MKDTRREIRPNEYDAVRIKIASPETIMTEWSHGEVTKPDTLNYRTLKPKKMVFSANASLVPNGITSVLAVNIKRNGSKALFAIAATCW